MTGIVWQDPPAPKPSRLSILRAELQARPGRWAKIASGPVQFLPWWTALANSDDYEMRYVRHNPNQLLGPHDVLQTVRH
jgi:hypothetical protein